MKDYPSNINPEDEQAYIEWIRKTSFAERFAIMEELSKAAMDETKASIRCDYPQASEEELKIILVETLYGKELADRVKVHLQQRKGKEDRE